MRKPWDSERLLAAALILASKDAETRRWNSSMEEHSIVSDAAAIGCVGKLVVASRGDRGPGEVLVTVRGSKETFLAWSDDPLPKGTKVLVVEIRGGRTVVVEPWKDSADLNQE
jgi:membrane protein implicated in regulation of membrane protease activity